MPVEDEVEEQPEQNMLDNFLSKASTRDVWEEITLPSNGIYYGQNHWSNVPVPGGKIKVKPWGLKEEEIMTTTRYVRTGRSLDMVLDRCCKFPNGFKSTDLLIGDRNFLLYYFRGISYGDDYEFGVTCTNDDCKAVSRHDISLSELLKNIRQATIVGKEPFRVKLPDASKQMGSDFFAGIRFPRAFDATNIKRRVDMSKKLHDKIDNSLEAMFESLIVSAGGSEDQSKIQEFIGLLSARDSSVIRDFISSKGPGFDPTIDIVCPECENEMNMELPFSENFFRHSD